MGNATSTRRIQGVSAGLVSATSTDAINGSQLYALAGEVANLKSNSNTGWTLSNGTTANGFKVISQEVKLVSTDNTVNRTINTTNNSVDLTVNTAKVAKNLVEDGDDTNTDGDSKTIKVGDNNKLEVNTTAVGQALTKKYIGDIDTYTQAVTANLTLTGADSKGKKATAGVDEANILVNASTNGTLRFQLAQAINLGGNGSIDGLANVDPTDTANDKKQSM